MRSICSALAGIVLSLGLAFSSTAPARAADLVSQDGLGFSGVVDATPIGPGVILNGYNLWPEGFTPPVVAFRGAVAVDDAVWLVPSNADRVVRIDRLTGVMQGFSDWPEGFTKGEAAFAGGVYEGQNLWLVPLDADRVVRLDPATGTMTGFNNWPAGLTHGVGAFAGGVWDGQNIWLVPYDANQVVKLDPATGTMTGFAGWPSGFVKGPKAFWGGVFDGEHVWLVPYDADRVIRVDIATGAMTGFNGWPSGFTKGPTAFAGGTFDGESIWLSAYDAQSIVKVRVADGTMTSVGPWPTGFTKPPEAFAGAIFDGTSVWFIPFNADRIIKADRATGALTAFSDWSNTGMAKKGEAFVGGAFDGRNLWMAPFSADRVVRVTAAAPASNPLTSKLANLSSRARLLDTSDLIIAGLVITGPGPKQILLRGVGPTLGPLGVQEPAADPFLRLLDKDGQLLLENEDWSGDAVAAAAKVTGAFGLAPGSKDAAVLVTLDPGLYTVHIGDSVGDGVALAEAYDVTAAIEGQPRLVNISTRATVSPGEGPLIGGFVVSGSTPKKVLVRGIGPALAKFNVTDALVDSELLLFNGANQLIARNDDWETGVAVGTEVPATAAEIEAAAAQVGAFALEAGAKDASLLITLPPGNYTAQVLGKNNTTGAGLVEVYEVPEVQ